MKFKFRIGDMDAKSIVKGIFICELFYLLIPKLAMCLDDLGNFIPSIDFITSSLSYILFLINVVIHPILLIILIKLFCDALYKVIKAVEILAKNKNI